MSEINEEMKWKMGIALQPTALDTANNLGPTSEAVLFEVTLLGASSFVWVWIQYPCLFNPLIGIVNECKKWRGLNASPGRQELLKLCCLPTKVIYLRNFSLFQSIPGTL